MTLLDDIIEASTDSTTPCADLLRKVKVVAHRLRASDVQRWVDSELNGYDEDTALPKYRRMQTPVVGTFSGPMRSFLKHALPPDVPKLEDWWEVELRQPLLEIQSLAEGPEDSDAERQWPPAVVSQYEATKVFTLEYMSLYQAANVISRQRLRGVVDIIKTKALDFALELQSATPDAGVAGGPTVDSSPAVQSAVYTVTNNIYGDGANIGTGSGFKQHTQVAKGDSESLRAALSEVLADSARVAEFASAVEEDQEVEGERVQSLLAQVRDGTIRVVGDIGTKVAASTLISIAKAYIGI